MHDSKRQLSGEFLAFMRSHDALPEGKRVTQWLRDHKTEIKTGMIGKLFNSELMSASYAERFVSYVRGTRALPNEKLIYATLCEYLQQAGHELTDELSDKEVAEWLFEPEDEDDYLINGTYKYLARLLKILVDRSTLECRKPADVSRAMEWVYITVGRELPESTKDLYWRDAIAATERRVNLSLEDYCRHVQSWADANPWAVVYAAAGRTAVGASVVLPLAEETYYEVREGQRVPHEIAPDELVMPSNYLFIKAAATRPPDRGGKRFGASWHLLTAIMRQLGELAQLDGPRRRLPLHILSFGSTPANTARLESEHYRFTKKRTPITKFPLYERIVEARPRQRLEPLLRAVLHDMGSNSDDRLGS